MDNELHLPRLVIAGTHGSAGKSTITIGLCAALIARGLKVAPFKKGPDFIDPMWLGLAAGGRKCHNLDPFLFPDMILPSFIENAKGADISIIEGNQGLYDSTDLEGKTSTAGLAQMLRAPVILVINARKMTRGVAALIRGFQDFEPRVDFAGVILNNVSGPRHEEKLRSAIAHFTEVEVLGVVFRDSRLQITERHLGLIPSLEFGEAGAHIETIGGIIANSLKLDQIRNLADRASPLDLPTEITPTGTRNEVETKKSTPAGKIELDSQFEEHPSRLPTPDNPPLRIGYALDRAFGFYYPENLKALERLGAELITVSPLEEENLPDLDALYLGGGFPEMFPDILEKNEKFRKELKEMGENGLPIFAECGGLMYLSGRLIWEDRQHEMVGLLPFDVQMNRRPQGHGYTIIKKNISIFPTPSDRADRETSPEPLWQIPEGVEIRAHEFHYSRIINLRGQLTYFFKLFKGIGAGEGVDGIIFRNVLAMYSHLHSFAAPWWAGSFVAVANQYRRSATAATR